MDALFPISDDIAIALIQQLAKSIKRN